ncbi:MAG TPA: hypothetical protein VFA75_06450 [Nevskia sp.]|nr:hypothetical protein [Nevskia sp.]
MQTSEILAQIALGALVGTMGQGARVVVGLKKAYDDAQARNQSFKDDVFDGQKLGISLFIGALAGGLGVTSFSFFGTTNAFDSGAARETVMKLLAIGYAGTDFIEGFIQKYLPSNQAGKQKSPAADQPADDHVDGCGVPVEQATADKDLPPAKGGVV